MELKDFLLQFCDLDSMMLNFIENQCKNAKKA